MLNHGCTSLLSIVALNTGQGRGVLEAPCTYEMPRNIGRQSSEESSQFHEELAALSSAMTEVQEVFTQLLENFDSCAPHSQQQERAMNELWSFYESHSDELEAGAAELETLLCTRHLSALGQNAMHPVSAPPSDVMCPQRTYSSVHQDRQPQLSGKQRAQHRRSRSMS